jgi:hypothetical protein
MNQWQIIKQAIQDIEQLNDFSFGNASWKIIKRMEREIIAQQSKQEAEMHATHQRHINELERMVYECVSLADVMRNGLSEETYNRITRKFEVTHE